MDITKLVKVSTYARKINKSVEIIRYYIRTGRWTEGKEYVKIDGVPFVVYDENTPNIIFLS